jgi:hypothetical protein
LRSSNFHFADHTETLFIEQLEAELRGAEHTLVALGGFRAQAECGRLTAALEQEIHDVRERVQTLLSLASEEDSYDILHYWWISNPTDERPPLAQAGLENALKKIVDGTLRERVAALLVHSRPERLAKAWGLQVDVSLEACKSTLLAIAFSRSHWLQSWTRACAMEVMVDIHPDGCETLLQQTSNDADELVRETSVWVLAKIDADGLTSPTETARAT